MIGAIIGDIAGSKYEFCNINHTNFDLLDKDCHFTDDTVCTLAIAKAILDCEGDYINLQQKTILALKEVCNNHLDAGYGERFKKWLKDSEAQPYHSFGNGAGMRISPVCFVAQNIDQLKQLSYQVTSITHNDPSAIKGAEAVSICAFLAHKGFSKTEIKKYIQENYYDLNFDLQKLRDTYTFDVSCDGSIPQAIFCFLESKSFTDAIKLAISIGGDSDTIACITGAIAQGYYSVPKILESQALSFLTPDLLEIYNNFTQKFKKIW